MDVTTMLSIVSLVNKLSLDFPRYTFVSDDLFQWSPDKQTVHYIKASKDSASLLHELAHAILKHTDYARDVQLIEIERDAWEYAKLSLAPKYSSIDDNEIQNALDTYRDWLHTRSTCPECKATGIQTKKHYYKCIACTKVWRVNDARFCALRRYST